MPKVIWVLVNANSAKEAEKIGRAVLQKRLCACFGIIPRLKSVYFWPPRSHQLESSRGPFLVLETLPGKYQLIIKLVRKLHSDKVPFIGQLPIGGVQKDFFEWLVGELK